MPVTKTLEKKSALVTGASSGIGRAIALHLARAGARVGILARRRDRLESLREEIQAAGSEALVLPADLTRPQALHDAFETFRQAWGDPEILVNNAGRGTFGPFVQSRPEDYDSIFNLNVRALMLATQEVLPAMIRRREGTIINISSIAGKMGMAGSALYCASKHAVMGFSEALLEEVRPHNIRVTVICPGMVNTEAFRSRPTEDRKDMIQPDDVAEAVLLAASATQTATFNEIVVRPRRPVK